MNNRKKLLCGILAVLTMTACRSGGGETTAAIPETTAPVETQSKWEGVEEWTDPVQTTAPVEETSRPTEQTTHPTEPGETTHPTVPEETTHPTEPEQTSPETTQPQAGEYNPAGLSYEDYLAMTPAEQQAHYEQFPNLEAYIAWHNAALAEYEENQNSIIVTGGFDIGDYMNP